MDYVLQKVTGAHRLSMVDGFSGYNQVAIEKEDQKKTTFTTPWGTFMYARMPFSLMNTGANFQREMDVAFVGGKFVVIYLDDVTIFSGSDDEHLEHLQKAFLKCRKFGLSLNPKKYFFSLEEGKLLGHIVSNQGVKIDPARVEAIQKIPLPRSKKDIQIFLVKNNFLRRFVPNYAEIVINITHMLKKNVEVKWDKDARESFAMIKEALQETPVLISPNYQKPFQIFSFASPSTITILLLQKRKEGKEQLVAFFSKFLRDAKLKYNILEK